MSDAVTPGQRRLIFSAAAHIGLRDGQLHDLIEGVSDYRTRAVSGLSKGEARRLIGVLKTMEQTSSGNPSPDGTKRPGACKHHARAVAHHPIP